jgi:hypothetical protein
VTTLKVGLLLAILAIPVQAQAPEGAIVISPQEREALIRKFGEQQEMLEELLKRYKHCMTTRST